MTFLNTLLRYYYFRFLEINVHHGGILLPVLIFMFASPLACHSASAYQISSKSTIHNIVMTSYQFCKMAVAASQFYFLFRVSWVRSFGKIDMYLHTKFRRDMSIHGWDITTSTFWKQMFALIAEFYFQFWFSPLHRHWHVIPRLSTKFRPNRTVRGGVMTSYPFFKMAATASQFYFRFCFS